MGVTDFLRSVDDMLYMLHSVFSFLFLFFCIIPLSFQRHHPSERKRSLKFYKTVYVYTGSGQLGPKTSRPRTTRPIKKSAQDNSAQVVPISEDNSVQIAFLIRSYNYFTLHTQISIKHGYRPVQNVETEESTRHK